MLATYSVFIVLNLSYSFLMRNVRYCRFWFAALTAPTRLYLGSLLTGSNVPISVYFAAYFFMAAAQASKVRIENKALNKSFNGWAAGVMELLANIGFILTLAAYAVSAMSNPMSLIFLSIAAMAHVLYNVMPYFNRTLERLLFRFYTSDCASTQELQTKGPLLAFVSFEFTADATCGHDRMHADD